jgi:hypothetical protein
VRGEVKRHVKGVGGGWFFTGQDTQTLKVYELRARHFTGWATLK